MALPEPPKPFEQPKKKSSLKTGCLVAVGIFLLIGFIGSLTDKGNSNKPATSQAPSASQTTAPAKAPEPPKPPEPKKDEFDFSLKDEKGKIYKGKVSSSVGVVVLDAQKRTSVGSNQFSRKSANPGATFVVLRVAVLNNRKDSVTMDSSLFKLLWDGKEYSIGSEAMTALMMDGVESFFLKQINPGIQVQGVLAFETPSQIDLSKASLQFSGGFFGRATVVPAQPVIQ